MSPLRRYLVAGLLVWVPLGVTVLVIRLLVDLMDRTLLLLPLAWRPEQLIGFRIPGLGIVLAAAVVLVTGVVVANLLGRQLVALWERFLARIPLVRSIYAGAKQVAETVFSGSGRSFREVVMIEYPRAGTNPTSGFFLRVRRADVVPLKIPVEEGLKVIISAGVLVPENNK
jgi:uncharacterized membrane protein